MDGQLYTCGANQFGQLGYQTDFNSKQAGQVVILQDQRITMVACGDTFTVAVSEGRLYTLTVNRLVRWSLCGIRE